MISKSSLQEGPISLETASTRPEEGNDEDDGAAALEWCKGPCDPPAFPREGRGGNLKKRKTAVSLFFKLPRGPTGHRAWDVSRRVPGYMMGIWGCLLGVCREQFEGGVSGAIWGARWRPWGTSLGVEFKM